MADVESKIADELTGIFRELYGDIPFNLTFVHTFETAFQHRVNGECDFNQNPPLISIRSGLNEANLIETLCHELAHLRCGLTAGHDEIWEACRDNLSVIFGARSIG